MAAETQTPSPPVPEGFLERFLVLRGAMRELWLVFAIKFLGITAYAVTNYTLVLWLSSDFGFSDQQALGLVAAWSLLMTVGTILVGSLTDAIGLRRAFFLGTWVCIFARSVMAFSPYRWLALAGGLLPLAIGEALGTPVLVAAVRRYSNTRQRSIAFSLFYVMMNVGFLVAAYLFDFLRQHLGEHGHLSLPLLPYPFSTYRVLLAAGLLLQLLLLPLLWGLRDGATATDAGCQIQPRLKIHYASMGQAFWRTIRSAVDDTLRLFGGLLRQAGFYRLLSFLLLIAFLKLIFMQMYYVYPKFGIRELGDGAPVGRLWAINSILVILLVPIIGALTQRYSAYRMVIVGGLLSAGSVYIMSLPTAWFAGLAHGPLGDWIGHGYLRLPGEIHPYYVMIALYVALLSVGEAFYSPRVYEYAAAIAPPGQEASYGALSYIPFLLAKLLVGTFSGYLLARYCPEKGVRHSETMWLLVALTATIAPAGLIALRRYIRVPETGRTG